MRMLAVLLFALCVGALPQDPEPRSGLAGDARVGVVVDRQGTVLVRPVGRERWSPVGPRSVLLPGDQLRTSRRGANAVEVRLQGGGRLVMGPGGLAEVERGDAVRLYEGDLEIKGGERTTVAVRGPGGFQESVKETALLRAADRTTTRLERAPRWLTGYRSSTTDEWMGSLVATVDGRDVPLSVGYHKVTVEIRDQIARTTIEESFVNATPGTLEGVFYFPLPADASISGFGMWIGGELVEADIVEKQKARRIYEDILRRKKDPGLLEWAGGNLFKARVYPILPHAEKRIRIRYTQVLPLEGSTLRYRYALRSELLRSRPLRELRLNVIVSSTMPIREVHSPTHEIRTRKTAHAASAEFVAEEFTPDRDFEVAVELDRSGPLAFVPHRRAEDGYFMLLFAPPADDGGAWQRDLVPEAGPLDVLIIADTSGSMDPAARDGQAAFIAALLGQLGRQDRFRLMTADVNVRWFSEEATAVTDEAAQSALAFLDARRSLGWSDLDLALQQALERAGPHTQVIYVGDGIGTTGDADPVALARRLRNAGRDCKATAHAVSVSSTFEKGVLEAIAGLGGGSVRAVGDDPAGAAFALLKEVARPPLRDLKVSIEGLRTARVYPATLPNLPAGSQQVILGRFLPAGGRRTGKVTVTGTLEGKPVRYSADLVLDENETGNSFVPRLWARRHIDALLEEGRSPAVQEEVVRFSEEFGIMTPFTSFLVLESDADRERYGVERRVKMRDGERFFAEGRDAATTALLREQMKLARTWRQELRKQMLREIATLGEHLVPATVAVGDAITRVDREVRRAKHGADRARLGAPAEGARFYDDAVAGKKVAPGAPVQDAGDRLEAEAPDATGAEEELIEEEELEEEPLEKSPSKEVLAQEPASKPMARARRGLRDAYERQGFYSADEIGDIRGRSENLFRGRRGGRRELKSEEARAIIGVFRFPDLPAAPKPGPERTPPPEWPADILALVQRLDRRDRLAALATGLELEQEGGPVHGLTGRFTDLERARGLYGKAGWFVEYRGRRREPLQQWLSGGERGALAAAVRLGRRRTAGPTDLGDWRFPLRDDSVSALWQVFRHYTARIVETEGDRVVVELSAPAPQRTAYRLVIDRARGVLLEKATLHRGEVTGKTVFGDFVEAAGMWWASAIEQFDRNGLRVSSYRLSVKELEADAFAAALAAAVSGHEDVIFLGAKDPELEAAKQAVFERRAGFAEHYRMALHFAASGQWDRSWEAWNAAEETVKGKPGARWLRAALLARSRRNEDLKVLLAQIAPEVAGRSGPATDALARYVIQLAGSPLHANERLGLLETLRPAFYREAEDREWRTTDYERLRAELLGSLARREEALAIYARIAAERHDELQAVLDYIGALIAAGQHERAVELLESRLRLDKTWLPGERDTLYERLTTELWQLRDLKTLATRLDAWMAAEPVQETAYQRYLTVLLFRDEIEAADAWVAARLSEAIPDPTTEVFRARLGAAIRMALGHGWNFYGNRIEEKWLDPLAALARRLLKTDDPVWAHAARITGDWRFRRSDAFAGLRKAMVADLAAPDAIESMEVGRLGHYVNLLPWGRDQVDAEIWRHTVDRIRARFLAATEKGERRTLATYVLALLDAHGEKIEAADFLRMRLAAADEETRPAVGAELLDRLLALPWSAELENEIIALVNRLEPANVVAEARRAAGAAAARRVTAALRSMRYRHALGEPKDYEKLPRAQLRQRKLDAQRSALEGLIARYAAAPEQVKWAGEWFALERVGLEARLGKDLKATDGEARELLFAAPADSNDVMDSIRRERCAYVLAYCATRRKAPEGLADAVVKLFTDLEQTQATAEKGGTADPDGEGFRIDWRRHLFRLLVALDRADELAKVLEAWIVPAKVESRWRIAYGYLMAETGKLEPAIASFEQVAALDELRAVEYQALANWYLVVGDESRREEALFARYRVTPEGTLRNQLYAAARKVSRRGQGVPEELDPDTLRLLRALLAKAGRPANYVWQVQQLYQAVKDFRLLECLAEGVTGHSAAGMYPFLERVGRVIGEVHEEATCDALAVRIRERSEGVKSDLDRRGLLLLSALVERRAAEVLNAPGPHAERGLAAMQAAFKGDWLPGERPLMAGLLASLGRIPQPAFAAEQMRQLRDLYRQETAGTTDRLTVGRLLFQTEWKYARYDAAIDGLTATLAEYREARGGVIPNPSGEGVDLLVGWLESRKRFRNAEAYLEAEYAAQTIRSHRNWCRERLFRVWVNALGEQGAVSFGEGEALYREARKRIEDSMWRDGPDRLRHAVSTYCALHRAAQKKAGIRTAGEDLARFADEKLPELFTLAHTDADNLVSSVANELVELLGPLAGIRVVLDRLESEPRWFARAGQGGWNHFGWSLARWRSQARDLGELEPRLLRVVLEEIERDLLSLQARNRSIYHTGNRYFWRAKREEFAAVAARVAELNPDSPARLLYAANYLWDGLLLRDRAIGMLLEAEGRGQLRENGRHRLVTWLHHERRFAESLPLLEKLRAARPDRLEYRTLTVRALHETARDEAARELLDESMQRFKKLEQWNEGVMAAFANVARECDFHDRAIALYEEVIPLHQRTHRNRGVGGGTLSNYYGWLAQEYIAVGRAEKAVDAASAAVVAWGPTSRNRGRALRTLQLVIEQIGDLDAYVAQYERKVAASGLDAPVIRRALGLVYLNRKQADAAIRQLRAARELQPADDSIHQALVKAYDLAGDAEGACEALFASIRMAPMNLELYPELARRLAARGDPVAAERAWTSLVEAKPNEAESHQRLAKHREEEKRFADAVVQWRQVVRCRAEEPDGWFALARAQIRAGDPQGARTTADHLLATKWESRFGDVRARAASLLEEIRSK